MKLGMIIALALVSLTFSAGKKEIPPDSLAKISAVKADVRKALANKGLSQKDLLKSINGEIKAYKDSLKAEEFVDRQGYKR